MNVINLIDGTSVIFSKNNGAVHLRKDHISQKNMKKNKKQKDDFRKELDAYQAQGIPLWLDGEPSSPKEIWKAHKIAEDISYMRDYVPDSYGRLLRLEFDAVKKEDGYTQKL